MVKTAEDLQTAVVARIRLYFREGERTIDGRVIDPGAVNFDRAPPLPIMIQTRNPETGGHAGAELAGTIDAVTRDGNTIVAEGPLDLGSAAGLEASRLVSEGVLQTWSPDIGDATVDIEVLAEDEDGLPEDWLEHLVKGTFAGATITSMPAIDSAVIEGLDAEGSVVVPAPDRLGPDAGPAQERKEPADMDEPGEVIDDKAESVKMSVNLSTLGPSATNTANAVASRLFGPSAPVTDAPWDGSASRFDDDQYRRASAGCRGTSDTVKQDCFLPHHEPDGRVNRNGVHAAAGRFSQTTAPADRKNAARGHLAGHYTRDLDEDVPDVLMASIAACAGPADPPEAWFADPELSELQRFVTITDEGRVYGHLAGWGECHIGYTGTCVEVPREDDFPYFRIGQVRTREGTLVATGALTLRGGHCNDMSADLRSAQSHYDDTDSAWADVAIGNDAHGIWFSGAVRPNAADEAVRVARASGVSGDWRGVGGSLRLIAACAVNVPGFPKVRARVASGQVVALVAAGGHPEPSPGSCGCRADRRNVTLEKRVDELESLISAAGLRERVLDELAARIA